MFSIDKTQEENLHKWIKEQNKKNEGREIGAIGGVYTYSFTPTTLGVVVKVTNNLNNETIDVSDYDWW